MIISDKEKAKTWDVRWYWLRNKKTQEVLNYYWDAGKNNDADYFTKNHAPKHHCEMRPRYILQGHNVATLAPAVLGCAIACAKVCFSPGRYKPLSPPMATSVIPKYDGWT